MIHLTLNTGHSVDQDLDEIPEGITDILKPLLSRGGTIPGFAAFRVEVAREAGRCAFTIFRGREPIATSMLAITDDAAPEAWEALEELYLDFGDKFTYAGFNALPDRPACAPWLAVLLFPQIALQTPHNIGWMGDFDRCFAAEILRDR